MPEPQPVEGVWPKGVSQPASRALARIGVHQLVDIAGKSAKDLLALHGVGPKSLRIISEALAKRGFPPLTR